MSEAERGKIKALAGNDAALVSWLAELARATPDVYVRDPLGGIQVSSRLRDDLGVDSIGRVCVFYALVEALDSDADESACATWTTVEDVLRFVRASLRG